MPRILYNTWVFFWNINAPLLKSYPDAGFYKVRSKFFVIIAKLMGLFLFIGMFQNTKIHMENS